jgi:hypothetical protein
MADAIREHGLAASWRVMVDEVELRMAVEEGRLAVPIIGEWRRRWAHYTVLVAYEDGRGYGFLDPARATASIVWMTRGEFFRLWRPFGRTVVFVAPVGVATGYDAV